MKYQVLGPDDPALQVLAEQLKAHPEWDAALKIIPWAEYQGAVNATLQAPTSQYQAVCVPGHIWMPGLVEDRRLANIDDLLSHIPSELMQAYGGDDIIPSVARESRYQGKQYMLPLFTDGHIIFYRTDLLDIAEENGIRLVSPLQIAELASSLQLEPGMNALALKAHPSEIFLDWLPYFWAFGGELLDQNDQPVFNSPAGVESLAYYCALKQFCAPDTHTYGNQEIVNALKEGRTALAVSWGGQAAVIFDESNPYRDRIGTAVFPKPWNATWGVCLPANQPKADQTGMLSVLFAAASAEQDRRVTRIAGSPVRISSYQPNELSRFPWLTAQQEMLLRCQTLPTNPAFGAYLERLYEAAYLAFTGQISPTKALINAVRG